MDGKGGPLLWNAFSQIRFFSGGALSTFIHISLGKAGPFTLENHIHVKALKMQGVPYNYIDALLNPYQKNSTQTIVQSGTPSVTQILNNVFNGIVSMTT